MGHDIESLISAEALDICRTLHRAGHDAVIVGGPVRDALSGVAPNDFDMATSALPDEVRRIFPRSFSQGQALRHGTVGVRGSGDEVYEVTTYRLDVATDGRHARVAFTTDLTEDLARRDFTINAIAFRPAAVGSGEIVDPFNGRSDLARGRLTAVGDADRRFEEDHLRVLRAHRFAARFDLAIDPATRRAMQRAAPGVALLSAERVRDELLKLAQQARKQASLAAALRALHGDGIFDIWLPEVAGCAGVTQNEHHAYDVLDHLIETAAHAAIRTRSSRFFLALLLHDIGKRVTRTDEGGKVRFIGHEMAGAEMAPAVLERLRVSREDSRWITEAVRHHMRFLHGADAIYGSDASGRRMVGRIERDLDALSLDDLIEIRICDRLGSGLALDEETMDLSRRIHALQEQRMAQGQPAAHAALAVGGREIIDHLGMGPGPAVGRILRTLHEDVIEEKVPNEAGALLARAASIAAEDSTPDVHQSRARRR